MPQLGYGVYQVEPDECERYVVNALSVGSIGRRSERTVHQPYPHPDWREIWQDCRTSSLALAVTERRNHHPEDRSQGTNAGESESLRLRT